MNCLIELHYLPSVPYFMAISRYESIVIEKYEHYEKQSYRNRCHINTSQGLDKLIIPVTHKAGNAGKTIICDIKIDYTQKWLNRHWRAIESAYRKAPYWEHYADELHQQLYKRHEHLYTLNFNLLTNCLKWLRLPMTLKETMAYEKNPLPGLFDMRSVIHAKKPELINKIGTPVPYQQVFGKYFVKNLSVIDLLFCEGPNARNIILASVTPD